MKKIFDIFSNKKEIEEKTLVTIDFREKNSLVPSHLVALGFKIQFSQLPVADYLLGSTAIERKTIQDLKSSIIDKRIFSQIQEIKQYPNPLLIIEGQRDTLFNNQGLHENAMRGFLLSLTTNFKIPIIFTQDEKETANYIRILSKRKSKPFSLKPSKTFKTKEEQVRYILESFPNIGPVKSNLLIKKFKSLKNLFLSPEQEISVVLKSGTQDFLNLIN